MSVFSVLFSPLFSGQQECNIRCLDLFSTSSDRDVWFNHSNIGLVSSSYGFVMPFPDAILYLNNVTFLNGVMLIPDEPLLSGQLPFSRGWPLYRGSTVFQNVTRT